MVSITRYYPPVSRIRQLLTPRLLVALTFVGLTASLTMPGCTPDSEKNRDYRSGLKGDQPDPGCIDQCVHVEDGLPQPEPVDCRAAEEGTEFYPIPIWDFDRGLASNMYTYTDNSSEFLDPNSWEAPTEFAQRCENGNEENQALHIRGGPFLDWGGGIGRGMKCLNYSSLLGSIKMEELGIEPNEYLSYGNEASATGDCDTDDDCPVGGSCVEEDGEGSCTWRECTSNDDCVTPGFYCPPAELDSEGNPTDEPRTCTRYTPDPACGAAPRWYHPELDQWFEGEDEGACAPGNALNEGDPLYEEYRELVESACPERDRVAQETLDPNSAGEEEFLLGMTVDMTEWDGISFWARRTLDSQAGIRVAVGDKYVDEDLSYLQYHINAEDEPYCQRIRNCQLKPDDNSKCQDDRPCTRMFFLDSAEHPNNEGEDPLPSPGTQNPQECGDVGALVDLDGIEGDTNGARECPVAQVCLDPEKDLIPPNYDCSEVDGQWECVQTGAAPSGVWHQRCAEDCSGIEDCIPSEDCPEGHPCSTYEFADPDDPDAEPVKYCWNPVRDFVPGDEEIQFQTCGSHACELFYRPFQRSDAQFKGDPCTEFAFTGGITRSFCYDPEEEGDEPAEGLHQCGDLWLSTVYLSTEWQFYKIPFDELLQQGWAKEAHQFDLSSVGVVRFTWDRGWVDYWIDDVRFYRDKKDEE